MPHFMTEQQRDVYFDAILAGETPPPVPDIPHCSWCGETDNLIPCYAAGNTLQICCGCAREEDE
jgi:hypothetical protein